MCLWKFKFELMVSPRVLQWEMGYWSKSTLVSFSGSQDKCYSATSSSGIWLTMTTRLLCSLLLRPELVISGLTSLTYESMRQWRQGADWPELLEWQRPCLLGPVGRMEFSLLSSALSVLAR